MTNNALNDLTENKLILLYILKNLDMPLTNVQITDTIMNDGLMNYFVLQQYLSDLVNAKQIKIYHKDGKQLYKITHKGRETLTYFENRIDFSKRENLHKTILNKKADFKRSTEVISDYTPSDNNEYIVDCKIIENHTALIELKLTVGTKAQAKAMCEDWKKNPSRIYSQIISAFAEKENKKSL